MKTKSVSRPATKAVLIGLDGANPGKILSLVGLGRLPNIARLIERGTLCANALAPYPTLTGSNWQTIATGAWPGTHGVTDMSYHVTGEPLQAWHSGFKSTACEAEYLWEAAARAGKRSILLKYTGSWPPRGVSGVQVDGGGGRPFWGGSMLELSHGLLFSTDPYPNGVGLALRPAHGWQGGTAGCLETELVVEPTTGNIPDFLQFDGEELAVGERKIFQLLLRPNGCVAFCDQKDTRTAIADVCPGEWSDTIVTTFTVAGAQQRGMFRIKVLKAAAADSALTVYVTQIYPVDAFCSPATIGSDLVERFGCYINHPGFSEAAMGWFDDAPQTFIELIEMQNDWLGRAAEYLMATQDWDLLMMQAHTIDFANHLYMPHHDTEPSERVANEQLLDRCYASVDGLVGRLTARLGPEVLVILVSDHGATPSPEPEVFANDILAQAGLLVYEESDDTAAVRRKVDMQQTQAVQQRSPYIYVSLAGRDPGGIVSAEAYENVREQIIDSLYRYREPHTGRAPFSLVLRKEDARLLGLWDSHGRDIGDIVYALNPEFDHEHGRQLPTARLSGHDMRPLVLFSGGTVQQGRTLERNVWLVDVVPTVATALGWPVPVDADGAVVYQAFSAELSERRPASNATATGPPETRLTSSPSASATANKIVAALRGELVEREQRISELTAELAQHKVEAEAIGPSQASGSGDEAATLRRELEQARLEAKRWKTAYERYHRITHKN